MKLLDLFCGAGGTAWGYHLAGFTDITGVDILPQPKYPFTFIRSNALEFPLDGYDLIHASPPCQAYSKTHKITRAAHPRLIEPIRGRLLGSGTPYVIENVAEAPLRNPVMLCGRMFGLLLYEHRLFETSFPVIQPGHPEHVIRQTKMGRPPEPDACMQVTGHFSGAEEARKRMGISWMGRDELAQAVPPAYTEYIGLQFRVTNG